MSQNNLEVKIIDKNSSNSSLSPDQILKRRKKDDILSLDNLNSIILSSPDVFRKQKSNPVKKIEETMEKLI